LAREAGAAAGDTGSFEEAESAGELMVATIKKYSLHLRSGEQLQYSATKFRNHGKDRHTPKSTVQELEDRGAVVYRGWSKVPANLATKSRAQDEGLTVEDHASAVCLSGDSQSLYLLFRVVD
jgi:hypothetical protein